MKISDILVNSIKYPLDNDEDITNTIILFGILVVGSIVNMLFMGLASIFDYNTGIILLGVIIEGLFVLAFWLLCPGYMLSVMDEGINQSDIIPTINIGKNIVDTIKLAILGFIYFIIPFIIGIVVILISGTFDGMISSMYYSSPVAMFTQFTSIGLFIVFLIFVFFELLYIIATLRMARFDSLGAALSFGEVWADLKDIGIVKTILVYSLIAIISGLALAGSLALIVAFPIIGYLGITLIAAPIVSLFSCYALGLLYSEIA